MADVKAPELTIQVFKKGVRYTANWSAQDVSVKGFVADTPVDAIQRALDSIKRDGARIRRAGRPPKSYWAAQHLVRRTSQ